MICFLRFTHIFLWLFLAISSLISPSSKSSKIYFSYIIRIFDFATATP
nr:MAG TPA: hypothetical protein [Caudoviricetes sp.]DAN93820.1 MAG TPA: hypothetical protein [Caudoviricetes sp.]